MLKTDYIVRLIEQFGQALRRIVRQQSEGQHDEARASIAETSQDLLGLNLSLLDSVDTPSAADLLEHPEKLRMLATLMVVEAQISELTGEAPRAARALRRALELQLEALRRGGEDSPALREELADLAAMVDRDTLEPRYREELAALIGN